MRKILVTLLFLIVSLNASAQEVQATARDQAIDHFSQDLAALQAEVRGQSMELQRADMAGMSNAKYASLTEDVVQGAMHKAKALKDAWKGNPYVEVVGFSVAFSFTGLEVSVQFNLK